MAFTSYGLLFLFLPLTFFIYWHTHHKLLVLCIASYLFYAVGGLIFVPLLLGLSLTTYFLANQGQMTLGITINLVVLAIFKYWNFGTESVTALFANFGLNLFAPIVTLALPLGISFYIFKHIGYLLDIRARRFQPVKSALLFVTYSAFFPQISAGPMSIGNDTLNQLANPPRQIDPNQIYQGLTFATVGLAKKILIADVLSAALHTGLLSPDSANFGLIWAWVSVGIFALQLYFDFSAYTDIALGISLLFGIALPPNFDNPYLARTPADFWTRWHISLSTWFRIYLFFPFSRNLLRHLGSSHTEVTQYTSNWVTMGLIGLWHGAGWGFVLWGLYHGLLLNIYAWLRRRRIQLNSQIILIVAILIGWGLFLSPDLHFANRLMSNMFGISGIGSVPHLLTLYSPSVLLTATVALALTVTGCVEAANLLPLRGSGFAAALGVLVVLCLIQLGSTTEFIYVQF